MLNDSAARLDGRTRSRLTQARHAALATLDRPARAWWRSYLPVTAGATAAAVLGVMMWVGPKDDLAIPTPAAQNGSAFEDIDILADADAPDFVTEADELEFYEWAVGEVES